MLSPPIARSSGDGTTRESISSGCKAAYSTSAQRVTNQSPTAGTKQTGASRRSLEEQLDHASPLRRVQELPLARRSKREQIAENDYNRDFPPYVDTSEAEEEIDIAAIPQKIQGLEAGLAKTGQEMGQYRKELGFGE